MDYFEYLNKNIERQKQNPQQADTQNAGKIPASDDFLLFDENSNITQDDNGPSVFNIATSEQLNNMDYTKLVSENSEGEKETTMSYIMKDILSFKVVQEEADTDGDGNVSADEAKNYFMSLAGKDGDTSSLTTEDFDILLKEKNIDLEQVFNQKHVTPESAPVPAEEPTTPPQVTEQQNDTVPPATENSEAVATQLPAASSPVANARKMTLGIPQAYSGAGRAAAPVEKTINNMTLEELKAEKTRREATLKEKQNAVSAVHNGTNEKVKAANNSANAAKTAMETALKNDKNVKEKDSKDLMEVISDIDENTKKHDENAISINEHEIAISDKEQTIKNLVDNIDALAKGSSDLEAKISKLKSELNGLSKSKDEKSSAKKDKLQTNIKNKETELATKKKEIESKQREIKTTQAELNKLKKEKKELEKSNAKLEEEKAELENKKSKIELKIQKNCSPETKAKIKAYEDAKQKIVTVKASELKIAQDAQAQAMTAVKEVNAKITEVANRKLESSSAVSMMNINDISAADRQRYGVTEKTLPDGTTVFACRWSKFEQCQPEWLRQQQYILQAAEESGFTVLYSDVERTVAASNAGRARKGALVCKGGESPHNYGTAADLVVYKNGRSVNVNSAEYTAFARRAIELSGGKIECGINWRKQGERHHFELRNWRDYKQSQYLIT